MSTLLRLGVVLPLLLLLAAVSPREGTVTGVVTDAATGAPLAGANVVVLGTALGAATDAAGRFAIADVPEGEASVRASRTGYGSQTQPVTVGSGGADGLRFALAPAEADDEVVVGGETIADVAERTLRGRALAVPLDGAAPGAPPAPPPAGASDAAAPAREATPRSDAPPPDPDPDRGPRPRPGLLTAGDIDDGLNWDAFLGYVRRTLGGDRPTHRYNRGRDRGAYPDLDLDDRLTLHVVDAAGHPVAGARVDVRADGGQRARRLVTEAGTDGRLALFPAYDFGRGVETLRLAVRRPGGGGRAVTETVRLRHLGEDRALRVRLPIRVAERPRALDLAFVIDVTGSMGDELRYLTDEFEAIVERVERRHPGVDLRFGLVAYRDHGDQFVTRRWDFTRSAREMQDRLRRLRAQGGGDYPEAVDEALEAALDLDWRTGTAARVAFLVADAPPHTERVGRTLEAVREARARGLRLYPVAASGVADQAEYLMRAAAVLTQSRYLFLTDDSGVGLPHAEPKIACYQVTALDHLLVRVVASELEGRRVEPSRREVVREVGSVDAGVCETEVYVQRPPRRQGELGYHE